MAKPLGPKSILIREAITANPDLGNIEIATLLNGSDERKKDKIEVSANDIAQQKQAMKKGGQAGTAAPAEKAASTPAAKKGGRPKKAAAAVAAPAAAPSASPVDLIDGVFDLAQKCGGVSALKKLVDRLVDMQK